MNICPKCGLPKEACICEQLTISEQKIRISKEKRRFGKIMTIVGGFDEGVDIKKIAKQLKNELACGGTSKNRKIELQGDHAKKTKKTLIKAGFPEESIEIA